MTTIKEYRKLVSSRIQQHDDGFIHDFEFVQAVTEAHAILDMKQLKAGYEAMPLPEWMEDIPPIQQEPIQYWALLLEGIDGSKRIIAPFMSHKEADDYALTMVRKGYMKEYVWYIICTENPH